MADRTVTVTDGTRTVVCRVSHVSRRFVEVLWTGQGVKHFHRLKPLRGRLKGAEQSPWHIELQELERIGA